MIKHDSKRKNDPTQILKQSPATSIKRALKIFNNEPQSTTNFPASTKKESHPFLTYNQLQKVHNELVEAERQKAEGMRLIHEKNRCV